MQRMDRRRFIETSSIALGGFAFGGLVAGCGAEGAESGQLAGTTVKPSWKYAICNEIMQDWDWARQCRYAAETGYEGIEVAPFTLGDHVDDIPADRRAEIRGIAEEAGVDILGLHWLLVTPEGLHTTTPDEAIRHKSWDYMVKLAEFCADLGGKVMIFGSPGQRSSVGISTEEAVEHLTNGLRDVAPSIAGHGVQLLLEPLSSDQTDVINTLDEALAVVEAVNHPAVSTMFDFHNTADETSPLDELVHAYYDHIGHIQIQEMDGTYLGTGDAVEAYVPALQAFRDNGYDKWISLEVFDFEPGPEQIATASMATLRRMEAAL